MYINLDITYYQVYVATYHSLCSVTMMHNGFFVIWIQTDLTGVKVTVHQDSITGAALIRVQPIPS